MSKNEIVLPPVECTTAEEFLDAISPIGPYFRGVAIGAPWLFRGQGRDLPLRAKIFRRDSGLGDLTGRNIADAGEKRLAELDILVRFFEIADRRGLILPDDSQKLRSMLESLSSEEGTSNVKRQSRDLRPDPELLSLMALAQHYGLPTRLLDWTRQALIAAFFAAESAFRLKETEEASDRIVVWAFHFPLMGKHNAINRITSYVWVVTAPSATNANLKAQQGAFTLLQPDIAPTDATDIINEGCPMEDLLAWLAERARPDASHLPWDLVGSCLRKFSVPATEADRLLRLLAKLDITYSAVYPGYGSIVQDMRAMNRWAASP